MRDELRFAYCSVEMPTAVGSEHMTAKTPPITGRGIHSKHAPILGEMPKSEFIDPWLVNKYSYHESKKLTNAG